MMRGFVFLLAGALLGCGSGGNSSSQMDSLSKPEQEVVGKYDLKVELIETGSDLEWRREKLKELEMLPARKTSLECFPDRRFLMLVGKVEVKGDWSRKGTSVYLRTVSIGDVKPDKVQRVTLLDASKQIKDPWNVSEREEFTRNVKLSLALDRVKKMASMRIGADGILYEAASRIPTAFGEAMTYFKPADRS